MNTKQSYHLFFQKQKNKRKPAMQKSTPANPVCFSRKSSSLSLKPEFEHIILLLYKRKC